MRIEYLIENHERVSTESFGTRPKPFPARWHDMSLDREDIADIVREGLLFLGDYTEEYIVKLVRDGALASPMEVEELTWWSTK